MKAFFGNFTAPVNSGEGDGRTFRLKNNRINERNPRTGRRDFGAERVAAREREMKIREAENLRIKRINEQIGGINERIGQLNAEIFEMQNSREPINTELLDDRIAELNRHQSSVASLSGQIAQIHTNRAEREQLAIEREFQRQQQELEERMREREEAARSNTNYEHKTEEELEEARERSSIRNLTLMSARAENIGSLRNTRASLQSAAARLRGEADFDNRRQEIANEQIISFVKAHNVRTLEEFRAGLEAGNLAAGASWRPMGSVFLFDRNPLAPDGFRGRHLQNLNESISRLSANINMQISSMYRDSQNMQEEQLRIYREKSSLPDEDDDENRRENFDIRL